MVPTLVAPVWALRYAERMPGSLHPESIRKAGEVVEGHKEAFRRALDAGVRIAFGTDQGVGPHGRNAEELEHMVAGRHESDAGDRRGHEDRERVRPHGGSDWNARAGKLADLLIVDGDPLADIGILQDRAKLLMIMQGGRAHKNELETRAAVGV